MVERTHVRDQGLESVKISFKFRLLLEGALGEAGSSWSLVEDETCEFVQVLSSFKCFVPSSRKQGSCITVYMKAFTAVKS